jgi:hypothetical protein
MAFKILNLATGECYKGVISPTSYELPDVIFEEEYLALLHIQVILISAEIVKNVKYIKEQFEIIEV